MRRAGNSDGFSLVEVIVALGMMAGVLISVAGMLTLGGRYVKSGRNASEGLAVARDIMEELHGWGFEQTYRLFGKDGNAVSYTIKTDELDAVDYVWQDVDEPTWQDMLENLHEARAEIRIESLAGNLNVANAIRIHVTVRWREGPRPREVRLSTLRL